MANDTYLIDYVQFGIDGLDLHRSEERISKGKLGRMINVYRPAEGYLTTRPGQWHVGQVSGGGSVHSIRRLNAPKTGISTRIWGVDTRLFRNGDGELALSDSGYSGDPMHLVRHRPTISSESWMFIADRTRMRKTRADGLTVPIGLPAPTVAATTSLVAEQRTVVDLFQSTVGWIDVSNIGHFSLGGSHQIDSGPPGIGNSVQFRLPAHTLSSQSLPLPDVPTSWMWWLKPISVDLTRVGGRAATDNDLLHLYMLVNNMANLVEVRLYFVLDNPMVTGQFSLPGANSVAGVGNTEAYMKVFRKADFENAVQVDLGHTPAEIAKATADQTESDDVIIDSSAEHRLTAKAITIRREQSESKRQVAASLQLGSLSWSEFGVVDAPLRRGDFIRLGGDKNLDWANVKGLIVYVASRVSKDYGADSSINLSVTDLYLHGGYEIDNASVGNDHYDWRYTHYDPRTGAESNPSPTMATDNRVDTPRRAVVVDPASYLDSAVRQRFYRRGGANVSDWNFAGVNTSNGGTYTDEAADAVLITSASVDLDNDQPITTIDAAGNTVRAQPVPVLFGPVSDMLLALGDPERPGYLYWSRPGEPDHWPPQNNVEVCDPSEKLMTGVMFGDLAYVFSTERMYRVLPSLSGISGTVNTTSTAVKYGAVSRWAVVVGGGAIWFLARDGLYATTGGVAVNVSDPDLRPLFENQKVRGYLPIDFSIQVSLRLTYHDNDVYLLYTDSGGNRQVLVYSALYKTWRWYSYAHKPAVFYSDESDLELAPSGSLE